MTKKILAWLLAAMMLLSLAACAAKETPDAEDTKEDTSTVQETPDTTEDQPEVTKPSDEETDKTDTEAEKPDTEPDEADPEDTTTEDSKPETSEPEDTQLPPRSRRTMSSWWIRPRKTRWIWPPCARPLWISWVSRIR